MKEIVVMLVLAFYLFCSEIEVNAIPVFKSKIEKQSILPERGFYAYHGAVTSHYDNTIASFKATVETAAQMIL